MKRVSKGHGFWLSYILNMFFRPEWVVLAVALFIVFLFTKWIPLLILAILSLAVWFIYPLILTLVLGWAAKVGSEPTPHRENKNPYSVGNVMQKSKNNMQEEKLLCPCCKSFQLDEVGGYEICPVCNWEDDPVQRKDPDFAGGANKVSLNQARKDFLKKVTNHE